MMNPIQAILIGLLQGITELFPISSLGHSVLLPPILGWNINQKDPFFLTFLVATHAATALVLFGFFWKDWLRIIKGFFRSLQEREIKPDDGDAKLAWLLIVGTIPAGILGVLFEQTLKDIFAKPALVAFCLLLNGALLGAAEVLRRRVKERTEKGSTTRLTHLSWVKAVYVGILQCLALIPGFSRTGSTITGGLLVGLSHEDAARFSFFLATPIIAAASLLKLPELATEAGHIVLIPTLLGAISAGVAAYFSVKFLTKYFETKTLTPFAIYCFTAGAVVLTYFLITGP